ncbi:putative N(4)-(beta-N-acetylglucosaminyl)-L-asparaginase GD10667 [Drosophila bipectinata]|uniref:putative N(4)-(beta-N-acetylglucosaminyl)-L-asparaginase GD10667 n=1 Tax=Drosophila bipectinata TaxID=42026 RepID=UPI001C898EC5|nr:putative N(4)-(beta-N-acetylglucosaminyl)-L-asparaginase GD10667 isoform X1 [Drosophila bipectinata]
MRVYVPGCVCLLWLASSASADLSQPPATTKPSPFPKNEKTTPPMNADLQTKHRSRTNGPLLPMVINTWNFTAANVLAWRILKQSPGGLRQTRNAVVEGCSKCEKLQCDGTVGYGGSPDERGETTLDAMVMDGLTMDVGAVAGLRRIKDAIKVARFVLEHTHHTMLVGDAAADFAVSMGFESESLVTPESKEKWQQWTAENCQPNFWKNVYPDPKISCGPYKPKPTALTRWKEDRARYEYDIGHKNHDTIGMIAIDVENNIHAGTSTNGAIHKIPGRVGDSPIPGAGAYADNEVGAAVATGDGDVMMRFLPSLLAVEAMRAGKPPAEAAEVGIRRILKHHKDFVGAVIAVDRLGNYGASCYGMKEFPFVVSSPAKMDQPTRHEQVRCIPPQDQVNVVKL